MHFLKWFKKQNWAIKVGYISLIIGFVMLLLGLILIGAANFNPRNPDNVNPSLVGNGFEVISQNGGVSNFLTSQGYSNFSRLYYDVNDFISAPLAQLVSGIVFLVILLPIFGGIGILTLAGGYFKRWLYT